MDMLEIVFKMGGRNEELVFTMKKITVVEDLIDGI